MQQEPAKDWNLGWVQLPHLSQIVLHRYVGGGGVCVWRKPPQARLKYISLPPRQHQLYDWHFILSVNKMEPHTNHC